MSYCRFTEGDVYSYECDGGVQFYVAVGGGELDRLCNTFNEAYQYAKALRDTYGLDVPSHAIEALKADALEEAVCICGPDGAVAELVAENEKLRELVKHTWLFANRAHEAAYELCPDRSDPHALATISVLTLNAQDVAVRMRELGVETDG